MARASDGDDYIEGGGGDDLIFGNLGQDDIVGGSSSLFGLTSPELRPDGADVIWGGAGSDGLRNSAGDTSEGGHARDADVILGDNGNIFRIVGTNGVATGDFVTFGYDDYAGDLRVIPRFVEPLDYTPGFGDPADAGAGDLVRAEAGDDTVYGMTGNDALFGDGQDDDLYGGTGSDFISGGTGEDGIVGDDGRIFTSRDGSPEALYGIDAEPLRHHNDDDDEDGDDHDSIDIELGRLRKTIDLERFEVAVLDDDDERRHNRYHHRNGDDDDDRHRRHHSRRDYELRIVHELRGGDDTLFGGLGDDTLSGGAGVDGLSGAEALVQYFEDPASAPTIVFDEATGEFVAFSRQHPLRRIQIDGAEHPLNFDAFEPDGTLIDDGDDQLFGDTGADWLVGGTGADLLVGGDGNDLLNALENLDPSAPFVRGGDDDDGEFVIVDLSGARFELDDGEVEDVRPDPSLPRDTLRGGSGRDTLIGNAGDRGIQIDD